MSNRRKVKPHEQAQADQVTAMTRELARTQDGTLGVVTAYATSGQCSWCDCEAEQHGDTCAGCPSDAFYEAHMFRGDNRATFLLCQGHYGDFVKFVMGQA